MVVYLDLTFLLNAMADALALYATGRLAGLQIRRNRILLCTLLGGLYGVLCQLPRLAVIGGILPQTILSACLVYWTFGRGEGFLRRLLLFLMVACMLGGTMVAAGQMIFDGKVLNHLHRLNWKVFLLVTILCYILLSLIFCGSARHIAAAELRRGWIALGNKKAEIVTLLDTGHTLRDTISGRPVLIAEVGSLRKLWSEEEWGVLRNIEVTGAPFCAERLAECAPGRFRLLPYRAVGVGEGLLLCFRADEAALAGKSLGEVTVAISPTPISDGGGYNSLWNFSREEESHYAA